VLPDLYPVQSNNSSRLATPSQPSPYNHNSSNGRASPSATGANNQQAAQMLRASLMKSKNQANGQAAQFTAEVQRGPIGKLSRISESDSSIASAVGTLEAPGTDLAADTSTAQVGFIFEVYLFGYLT
jgi:hypothetical protein